MLKKHTLNTRHLKNKSRKVKKKNKKTPHSNLHQLLLILGLSLQALINICSAAEPFNSFLHTWIDLYYFCTVLLLGPRGWSHSIWVQVPPPPGIPSWTLPLVRGCPSVAHLSSQMLMGSGRLWCTRQMGPSQKPLHLSKLVPPTRLITPQYPSYH